VLVGAFWASARSHCGTEPQCLYIWWFLIEQVYLHRKMRVKTRRAIKQTRLANTCLYVTHTVFYVSLYSRTPLIRISWNGETSGYAKIRIIGFSLKIGYIGHFKWKKMLNIYLLTNKTLIPYSYYVFDNWEKIKLWKCVVPLQ